MNSNFTRPGVTQVTYKDNYEKGRAFELFITRLFNYHSFRLINWHKAEEFAGSFFPFDHAHPDLEMELVFAGAKRYRFAVECKWRKEFIAGKIEWATSRQICSYEDFQNRARMPVFVAIGIGGDPSNPEKLFVTPLNNISRYTEVYESQLISFGRKPTWKFFYDIRQLRLF